MELIWCRHKFPRTVFDYVAAHVVIYPQQCQTWVEVLGNMHQKVLEIICRRNIGQAQGILSGTLKWQKQNHVKISIPITFLNFDSPIFVINSGRRGKIIEWIVILQYLLKCSLNSGLNPRFKIKVTHSLLWWCFVSQLSSQNDKYKNFKRHSFNQAHDDFFDNNYQLSVVKYLVVHS